MKERHLEAVPDLPILETEDHEIPLLDPKEELTGNDRRNGYLGVLAVAGVAAAWDVSKNETITNASGRALNHENPYIRNGSRIFLGYMALHLLDKWPTKADPLDGIARWIGQRRG